MQPPGLGEADESVIEWPMNPPTNLRDRLRRIFIGTILALAAAGGVAYLVDYGVLRLRIATNRAPYGSVTVSHYTAIRQKSGKTELIFDPPQPETCVNALFSHGGSLPCWYLNRHPEQRTDI
jgi:hypothetical protein